MFPQHSRCFYGCIGAALSRCFLVRPVQCCGPSIAAETILVPWPQIKGPYYWNGWNGHYECPVIWDVCPSFGTSWTLGSIFQMARCVKTHNFYSQVRPRVWPTTRIFLGQTWDWPTRMHHLSCQVSRFALHLLRMGPWCIAVSQWGCDIGAKLIAVPVLMWISARKIWGDSCDHDVCGNAIGGQRRYQGLRSIVQFSGSDFWPSKTIAILKFYYGGSSKKLATRMIPLHYRILEGVFKTWEPCF